MGGGVWNPQKMQRKQKEGNSKDEEYTWKNIQWREDQQSQKLFFQKTDKNY